MVASRLAFCRYCRVMDTKSVTDKPVTLHATRNPPLTLPEREASDPVLAAPGARVTTQVSTAPGEITEMVGVGGGAEAARLKPGSGELPVRSLFAASLTTNQ